jgi:hypothetical protein
VESKGKERAGAWLLGAARVGRGQGQGNNGYWRVKVLHGGRSITEPAPTRRKEQKKCRKGARKRMTGKGGRRWVVFVQSRDEERATVRR